MRFCGRCGTDVYAGPYGQPTRVAIQGTPRVIVTKPGWVLWFKATGALLGLLGMFMTMGSCASGSGGAAGAGLLTLAVGMIVFIIGRFGD